MTLEALFQRQRFPLRSDLKTMRLLCERFGNPQRNFRSILIAGTNGKGSVATKIAKGLELEGYRVGLYTSPHLFRFNERIMINGVEIEDGTLLTLLKEVFEKAPEGSFFELATLMALIYFSSQQVDFAVCEVGLGGRLDATNVLEPIACAITSISLDHTEYLGNTIEEITREKAGIIKKGVPVFLGPRVDLQLIAPYSHLIKQIPEKSDLFQDENSALAKAILDWMKVSEKNSDIAVKSSPRCRMEMIQGQVPIICDVAHNIDGLKRLFKALEVEHGWKRFHIACGIGFQKDPAPLLRIMEGHCNPISFLPHSHERLLPPETLLELLQEPCQGKIQPLSEAYAMACRAKTPLLLTGSFYIMEQIQTLHRDL